MRVLHLVAGVLAALALLTIGLSTHGAILMLIMGGLALVGGIFLYTRYARPLARELQALQSTQRLAADVIQEMQAGDISQGGFRLPVEVAGIIECDQVLSEEPGAKPCAYYALKVDRVSDLPAGGQVAETVHAVTRMAPFSVKDRSGRIKVLPEGAQVEPPAAREWFVSAQELDRTPWKSLLQPYVHEARDRSIEGFRFFERQLTAGQRVKVVGMASDEMGDLTILRPEKREHPFLISAGSEVAFLETKRQRWQGALAVSTACVVAGLGMGIYGGYWWLVIQKVGEIYIRNETDHPVRITVDKLDRSIRQINWTYAPLEGTNYPFGTHMTFDKKPIQVQPGDQVTFLALRPGPPLKLVAGTSQGLGWNSGDFSWRMTVTEELLKLAATTAAAGASPPAAAPSPPRSPSPVRLTGHRSGRLYVKNLTAKKFTVQVYRANGTKLYDTYWTFDPFEAKEKPKGNYLSFDKDGVTVTPETGDLLKFHWQDQPDRVFTYPLDNTGPVQWNQSGGYWTFYVRDTKERSGAKIDGPRLGRLYVKNLTSHKFTLNLYRPDGTLLYDPDSWTFEPFEGREKTKGLYLTLKNTAASPSATDLVKFYWADNPEQVFTYPLDNTGPIRWNEAGGYWNFFVGEGTSPSGGGVWIKNLTNRQIEVQVYDAQGRLKGERWTLESQEGSAETYGEQLKHQGQPLDVQRGDIVSLTVLLPGPPVEGAVAYDRYFRWNNRGKFWHVTLTEEMLGGK